ncbi:MAG: hypothetical protein ACQESV_07465 [Thermodesulfobacteriota bacterium]
MAVVEIIRRLAALILLCLGGVYLVWPGSPVVVLKALPDTPKPDSDAAERRVDLPAPAWPDLVAKITQNSPDIAPHTWETALPRYVFPADHRAFADFHARTLRFATDPATGTWFSLLRAYPQEIYGLPQQFLYPLRWPGLGLIGAGLALYILLPRPGSNEHWLRYSRGPAVIAPDLLGLVLTPFFLALPVAVVANTAPGAVFTPTQGGWIWLYIIFSLLALLGIALLVAGLRYAVRGYRLLPHGLQIRTLRGRQDYSWSSLQAWESYNTNTSRRLGKLLLLTGSFSAIGLGLALQNAPERGLRLHFRGRARPLEIMANHLPGFADITLAVRDHAPHS